MMNEAIELLSRYLQIDTTNPPGNEGRGVEFFVDIFETEKVDYKIYEAASGRKSIRAVIPGSGEKGALILLNHIDVVPAQADQWSFEPFSGEVKDGFIHGRGALDMKGQGIMELLAFLDVKRKGLAPCRDIIFLAVADEEVGGKHGVEYLLDNHPDDFKADIIGSSSLLTTTMPAQQRLEEELKKAGLKERYKTMVGGAPVTQRWANKIGADGFAENATACVRLARELLGL